MFACRDVNENEVLDEAIDLKSEDFEKDLIILGITGVEDEL
jgi:magnesium-transporting ATPase (P-type)